MPAVNNNSSTTWKKLSSRLISCSALLGVLVSSQAMATSQLNEYFCADDISNVGNCTANEVSLSGVTNVQITDIDGNPLTQCYNGQIVKIANLDAQLDNNTGQRWDITFWVGRYGNDPRTPANDDPTACTVTTLPQDGTGAPYISDNDGDDCWDFSIPPAPVDLNFGDGDATFECRDSNGDGIADLIVLTTWQQNVGFVCGAGNATPPYDINDPVFMPGSPSKCDITTLDTVPIVAAASLTVTKVSQGGVDTFDFTGTGFPEGNVFESFTLDTTTPTPGTASLTDPSIILVDGVNGDTFTINETVPDGWSLANATCSNGDDPRTGVTLVSGDDVTCTFTDVLEGSVTIVKNTVGGDATFNYTSGTPPIPASFNIVTSGGTGSASTTGLTPGTYTVTETPLAGWDLTDLSCTDPNGNSTWDLGTGTVTINLDVGETITCTYENTQRGDIILAKTTTPSSTDVFSFTHNVVGDSVPASPVDVTTGTPQNFNDVVPGSYTITEADPTPAYDLNDIECADGTGNIVDSTWDNATRTATVNVDPGETVACQFLNVARGNLTVVKELSVDGPASKTFDFTSTALGDFQLTPTDSLTPASTTFNDLVEGEYDLAEADPFASGWQLVSAACTDGTDLLDPNAPVPGSVYVDPGENVTCTFVNSPLGSSTIIKNTVGGDDTFTYTGTAQNGETNPMDGLSLTTVGGVDSQDFSYQLTPNGNPYTVTEDTVTPPGWVLTNLECTEDGAQDTTWDIDTATATINVDFAEAVTCTFTNTADATLVVQKATVPSGLADAFTFTSDGVVNWDTSGATTAALADGQSDSQTGQPGVYSATETILPGFAITNITCSGETLSTIQIGDGTPAFEDGDDYVDVTLAAGETVTCVFENTALGSIEIVKNTEGGDGSFLFTSPELGGFQLDTSGNTASTKFSNLLPGDYMIGETPLVGWDLTSLSCEGETNTTYNYTDPSVTVSLADGEDIVCTFTNAARGSIVVAKATDPTGSTQSFDFTGDITATLTDGQLSPTVSVPAGQYTVTESVVAGWDVTDITCTDNDSSGAGATATFNVASGENVVCYFTNTIQRGQIIVDKQTAPAESPQLFDFTLTGGGVDQAFQLTDTMTPYNSGDLLPTSENGTYNLSEGALPEGWSLVSASCSDNSDPAAINLSPGEIVTCTFINAEAGQSTFTKVSVGGDDTFNFTNTGPSGNFSLTTVSGISPLQSLSNLEAGQYVITEEALAGWVLTDIVCTESADQDSVVDKENRTVTLNVQEGETINCTVTNTKNGSITVAKTTVPSGLPTQFAFTGNVSGSIGDGGVITVSDLAPGPYSSVEDVTAGWDLTSITCDDGVSTTPSSGDTATRTASFNLDPGEDVTCTFTNTVQYGTIIVDKTTLPAASPQSFGFTLAGGLDTNVAFALTDSSPPFNSGDLLPTSLSATYSVVETPVAGWVNTAMVCNGSNGAEDPAAISLDPDETVTCTFTNTQNSNLTIVKTTVGGDGSFDFTSAALGNFNLATVGGTAQVNYADLEPGVYDVAETGMPTAWTPVPAVCSDGSSADAIGIDAGESVTCEFVNLAPGDIIITVQTVGLPDQEFCFDVFNRDTDAYIGQFCVTTVDGIAQVNASTLPVGPYRIQEIPNDIYTLEEFVCDNGAQNDDLVLDPGDVITCPFRVVPLPPDRPDVPVPASSAWALVLLTLMLLASGWYFRPAVMRKF